jgi:hypothetical protein
MTIKEIRTSVSKVLTDKKVMDKLNGWPPSLPEFIALGGEEVDYSGAFYRCLNRKPEGRPEQFVFDNSAFNIRRMTQKEAEKFHKNELDKAIDLEKRGLLKLNSDMPLQLTEHSSVSMSDIERESYKDKPHKFSDRINALRKGK